MDYIINHRRFKKKYNQDEATKFIAHKNRINQQPKYLKNYYEFFEYHAKKEYKKIKNICLCGNENDILLSKTDRHCVDFTTVVCKNCGLVRAKDYYRTDDLKNFYKNFYRTIIATGDKKELSPSELFDEQKRTSKFRYDLLEKYSKKPLKNMKILDFGGGVGGILDHFDKSNTKYLADYYDPYLEFALTKNISSTKGGWNKIDFKVDVVILSHVIEHWNNFEYEIQNLINIQEENQTLNYIEFPGLDSIKNGRHECDVLGDLQVPHNYYFTSYVFENLMNRYGFEKVYIDSFIRSIFIYTGKKKKIDKLF